MELASAWLILDKHGSNVPIRGVTPAELVILVNDRKDFVGKHPIHDLKLTGKSKRADSLERQRLKEKYGGTIANRKIAKIDVLFPGQMSKLPQTFAELGDVFKASTNTDTSTQNPVPDVPDMEDTELAKLDGEEIEPISDTPTTESTDPTPSTTEPTE